MHWNSLFKALKIKFGPEKAPQILPVEGKGVIPFFTPPPHVMAFPSDLMLPTYLFSPSYMEGLLLRPCHHPSATTPVQILTLSMGFEKSPQLQTRTEVTWKLPGINFCNRAKLVEE